jgi:serine/threonine-protein kinase
VLLDKYRLEAPIGSGGQGAVWRAMNLRLETPVAIKLVQHGSDELHVKRLLREARTVARLNHRAVVRVFDVEQTAEGDVFIVMEHLEGETLGQLIQRTGRVPARAAVRLLLPVADALSIVHAAAVVHRDVKPDNIFLEHSEGRVCPKLLDFGTAKVATWDGLSTTVAGTFVGTPAYLAPEQVSHCEDVDRRADVWSFCVTLYECVTGGLPFEASTPTQALLAALEQEPSSAHASLLGDPALWAIIRRGLSKDPDLRWASFDDLGAVLGRWAFSHGVLDDACGVLIAREWLTRASGSARRSVTRPSDGTPTASHVARKGRIGQEPPWRMRGPRGLSGRRWMLASVLLGGGVVGVVGLAWALVPRPSGPAGMRPRGPPPSELAPPGKAEPARPPQRIVPSTRRDAPTRSTLTEERPTVASMTPNPVLRRQATRMRPQEPPAPMTPARSPSALAPPGRPLVAPTRGSRVRGSSSDLIDPY